MNRIEFTVGQFARIVSSEKAGQRFISKSPLAKLHSWLEDEVAVAIEGFINRPQFRAYASRSIRALRSEAQTTERRQIDAISAAMCRCANSLTRLSRKKRIANELAAHFAPRRICVAQAVEGSNEISRSLITKTEPFDELAVSLAHTAAIAERGSEELVRISDYFEPVQEFSQTEEGDQLQNAGYIVAFNHKLQLVGDFIVRCLFHRLDSQIATLDDLRSKLSGIMARCKRRDRDWEDVEMAWGDIESMRGGLTKALLSNADSRLRNSCIILTQFYAAFHSSPNVEWLGLSSRDVQRGVTCLRARVNGFRNAELLDRLVVALSDLQRLFKDDYEVTAARDEAIAAGKLVIDRSSGEVYWEGKRVETEWNRFDGSWKFLIELAKRARNRADVTQNDLYGSEAISITAMSTSAFRLRSHLPASLRKLIISGRTLRTYRLTLESEHIYFFD